MTSYIGDFAEDAVIQIGPFTTPSSGDSIVAPSAAFTTADIVIYKDGSATQKLTANGLTMTSPFDATTGVHLLTVDTGNDTGDAGFWVTGSDITVMLVTAKTVGGNAITYVLAHFSIQNRYEVLDTVIALPGQSAPPLTATLAVMISWLFKWLRNKKTSNGSQLSLFNDAGTVVDSKAIVNDAGGTYTIEELESGP